MRRPHPRRSARRSWIRSLLAGLVVVGAVGSCELPKPQIPSIGVVPPSSGSPASSGTPVSSGAEASSGAGAAIGPGAPVDAAAARLGPPTTPATGVAGS